MIPFINVSFGVSHSKLREVDVFEARDRLIGGAKGARAIRKENKLNKIND